MDSFNFDNEEEFTQNFQNQMSALNQRGAKSKRERGFGAPGDTFDLQFQQMGFNMD